MAFYLICNDCGWSGYYEELVALTDDLNDKDFNYCPACESDDFDEEEEEEEDE